MKAESKPKPGLSLRDFWPVPVALFYLAVFNVTYLMGWMKAFDSPDHWYFGIAFLASQSEMGWWYWFFGWLPRSVAKVKFVRQYVKRRVEAFKLKGFPHEINGLVDQAKPTVQGIWAWAMDELDDLINPPSGFRRRFFRWTLAFLRTAWLPTMFVIVFVLGGVPHLNILVGIPLCRALRRGSLLALMAGNTFTIYTNDKVVDAAFWLWAVLPVGAKALTGLALIVFFIIRHRRRKARNQKAVSR